MKIIRMVAAAGLIAATLGISGAASAQDYRGHRGYGHDRGRDHRYADRGHHYGRDRHHQRCRVEWRHHRQVRICR